MSRGAPQNGERITAMLLMAVVTCGAFWVRSAALATEMAVTEREQQLQALQQVRSGKRAAGEDLRSFSTLFGGQLVAWDRGVAGPYLVLRDDRGGKE